jgi:hypothetical protein
LGGLGSDDEERLFGLHLGEVGVVDDGLCLHSYIQYGRIDFCDIIILRWETVYQSRHRNRPLPTIGFIHLFEGKLATGYVRRIITGSQYYH